MAITITITEEQETTADVVDMLQHIAGLIDQGFTSGYYPTWSMDGVPADDEDEADDA